MTSVIIHFRCQLHCHCTEFYFCRAGAFCHCTAAYGTLRRLGYSKDLGAFPTCQIISTVHLHQALQMTTHDFGLPEAGSYKETVELEFEGTLIVMHSVLVEVSHHSTVRSQNLNSLSGNEADLQGLHHDESKLTEGFFCDSCLVVFVIHSTILAVRLFLEMQFGA